MRFFAGVLFLLCFSQVALAETAYVCTQAGMERRIEVVQLGAATVPCEVRYTKNGNTEVVWSAKVEAGYCEARAAEFVEKQRGWGWECVESGAKMSEPAPSDMPEGQVPE